MPSGLATRAASRRVSIILPLALAVAACNQGATPTGTSGSAGQYGSTFNVSVSRPTGGTLSTADGRIRCGTRGSGLDACDPVAVPWGGSLTLTATPDPKYKFIGWAADCSGTATTCTLDQSQTKADKWAAAAFAPLAAYEGIYFLVTIRRPDHGTVRSTDGRLLCGSDPAATRCGPTLFDWSATTVLEAAPDSGFRFDGWSGDCSGTGVCRLDTLQAASDKEVGAAFLEGPAPLGWSVGTWDDTVWQ